LIENVGLGDELIKDLLTSGILKIKRQTFHTTIIVFKIGTRVTVHLAGSSRIVTDLWQFNLDDVRA